MAPPRQYNDVFELLIIFFSELKDKIMSAATYISTELQTFLNRISESIRVTFLYISEHPELKRCMIKYSAIYLSIIFAFFILYYASVDPNALSSKYYVYFFCLLIPLALVFMYAFPLITSKTQTQSAVMIITLAVLFLLVGFYSLSTFSKTGFAVSGYLITIILIAIITCGLAIFFYIFNNYLKSLPGWTGFLTYLIFYIPCLLIQFLEYLNNEFRMTTNIVYLLFLLEIVFVLSYLYVPYLVDSIVNANGIILLDKTAFLDIPQQISHTDIFKDTTMNNYSIINGGKPTNNFRQNYAISMWIYLNPQPSNYSAYAKETTIFRYGNDILDLSGGKPLITYINNIKDPKQKDKYIFYFTMIIFYF